MIEPRKGKQIGKERYGRSALYSLLRNQAYIGRVPHKGMWYPGQQPAIIDRSLWDRVQGQLKAHTTGEQPTARCPSDSPLGGLLVDDAGNIMTPTFTNKRGAERYRYYVSQALLQDRAASHGTVMRIPATLIEEIVAEALTSRLARARKREVDWHGEAKSVPLRETLERVMISRKGVQIWLRDKTKIFVPGTLTRAGKGLSFQRFGPNTSREQDKPSLALVRAVCRAHYWLQLFQAGVVRSYLELARRERMNPGYVRRVMQLAFLAPELIDGIINGRVGAWQGVVEMTSSEIPLSWQEQRKLFASTNTRSPALNPPPLGKLSLTTEAPSDNAPRLSVPSSE
jgi:hypothetical protein